MKRKILIFLMVGTLPLIALECDDLLDPDPKLPPITTEGNNTMGCLINGRVWDIMGINGGKTAQYQNNALFIDGSRDVNGENNSVSFFFLKNVKLIERKTYSLTDLSNTFVDFTYKSCNYDKKHTIDGSITILRFDTKARVVSGTFEFTTYNSDCGDTVRVTEGRFDLGHLVL